MKRSSTYVTPGGASKRARYAKKLTYRRPAKRTTRMSAAMIPKIGAVPFPKEWNTKLTWNPDCSRITSATGNTAFVINLTSIYDPDYSNALGNFQPLYTDQVLSSTGPYNSFRVNGWKAKITLINVTPSSSDTLCVDTYIAQGIVSPSDVDTFGELQVLPASQTGVLGPLGSTGAEKTWYFNGRVNDYIPKLGQGVDLSGSYAASPAQNLYLGVGCRLSPNTITDIYVIAKCQVEYDVTLYSRDGLSS